MFERPILFYSNYCNYSKLFIQNLLRYQELFDSFIRINIDADPNTKTRPQVFYDIQSALQFKITDVPTIIVQNGEYILSGKEAFTWLEYQFNELNKQLEEMNNPNQPEMPSELQGFNPLEMGSFSDGYAGIDDSLPKTQSFQFLNQPPPVIQTPQENNGNVENDNQNNGINYSDYLQKRNNTANNISYQSSSQRPMAKSSNFDKGKTTKGNEVDKKYEQLLAEREMMFEKKQPKKVNFADNSFR